MSRKIVFVNQATGYLAIDIINEFAKEFDIVGVIYGDIRIQDVELNPRVRKSKIIEKSRKSNFARLLRWFIASVQIFFLLITKYCKYEIFYFSVPPFAYFSSLILRRRFSLLMWDVYPDALKSVGVSENGIIYRLWKRVNKHLFLKANHIYTIGEGPANLMAKYIAKDKIIIIPLWTGLLNLRPIDKETNPFILETKLSGKFIVQYSGNMGQTHNIESLIEVARLTKDDTGIVYLFIGRGQKFELVKELILKYDLINCILLPFQSDNIIQYSLAAADLSIILIDERAANVVVPSKVYNLLAVGSPLLGISPENSEISRLIMTYSLGKNFDKGDSLGIANFIRSMKNSPDILNTYRKNSLDASKNFTVANARKFYESFIT